MKTNYITYVLKSKLDSNFYVGYTTNLKQRLDEHNSGSTAVRNNFNIS
ncbi:MAG: GIY-YIG nuclease family protein [Ignavibacteriales bacterium]|nr:GIY-YIG nuclease family protein [Ignavibacteriales bacterium]